MTDDPLMLMAEYATDTPYHPIQTFFRNLWDQHARKEL